MVVGGGEIASGQVPAGWGERIAVCLLRTSREEREREGHLLLKARATAGFSSTTILVVNVLRIP